MSKDGAFPHPASRIAAIGLPFRKYDLSAAGIACSDPALVAAMKKLEVTVDLVNQSAPRVQQIN